MNKNFVSMRNGILDLDDPERGLLSHTPDFWCLNGLPYNYDPEAGCSEFADAVVQWQPDPIGQQVLIDWCGYCLMPGNPHQKFLLNHGDGSDGKSQYAAILRALCGEKNCASVGLEAFDTKNRFGLLPLLNKTLNIVGDANALDTMGEGLFKSITGGDSVFVDRKNLDGITGVLSCKFVLNCNGLPFFRDRSEGLWRRIIALEWKPIPQDKIVYSFAERIIANEISGIFNWALSGYRRVREHGLPQGPVLKDNLERIRSSIQHEIKFFDECIEFTIDKETTGGHMSQSSLMPTSIGPQKTM